MKARTTHEYDLAQSPPLSSDDLEHYKKKYNRPYNQTIEKPFHIQQWTQRDLNYEISRLAVYAKYSTSIAFQAFQALDHMMIYFHHHIHEPIFYPCKPIGPDEVITYKHTYIWITRLP